MGEHSKWLKQDLNVKTRVCRCCGKRKNVNDFYDKKPPYIHKIRQYTLGKMRLCKKCHCDLSTKIYKKRNTPEQIAQYQKQYHKTYISPLQFNYQILTQLCQM